MKSLNITFEDKEMLILEKIKREHMGNWHDFIMDLAIIYKEKKK